jgi:hypothetical protein
MAPAQRAAPVLLVDPSMPTTISALCPSDMIPPAMVNGEC